MVQVKVRMFILNSHLKVVLHFKKNVSLDMLYNEANLSDNSVEGRLE